ncbi:tetratricopeptide repeat protein [Magnetospirillum sp. UT-4]|uniref:tetratricopeptide repeat protein n=1 Tax=Magnetospirillum sp. UT-4 TaxID=2681467 RepID=UPI001380456C
MTGAGEEQAAAVALANYGARLAEQGDPAEAETALRRAGRLLPGHPLIAYNLGRALARQDRVEEAAECFRSAVILAPDLAPAWNNLGNCCKELMRLDESLVCHGRALALAPDDAPVRFNRALTLLLAGRAAEGWSEYEWRHPALGQAPAPEPVWDGTPGPLLVEAEGGLGDAIHFLRYASEAARRGAKVILLVPPALMRLAAVLPGVTVADRSGPRPAAARHAWLMSLPRLLGLGLEPPGGGAPYLVPPADAVEQWRRRLGEGRKVALCWAGNPRFDNDARRSLPFALLAPLLELDGMSFHSVQVGPRAGDGAGCPGLNDLSPHLTDLAETAAALAAMDLVISVDTAVAHLAGAIGVPCWLLLPFSPDWRWGAAGERTPLYDSLLLFRQDRRGDWAGVMDRVKAALETGP